MSKAVTVSEAKSQLSSLIKRVEDGEEIVIRRRSRPVAKLIRYDDPPARREMGDLKGRIWISDDFYERDEELERLFGTRD
jgi:prevent-host-death family protein